MSVVHEDSIKNNGVETGTVIEDNGAGVGWSKDLIGAQVPLSSIEGNGAGVGSGAAPAEAGAAPAEAGAAPAEAGAAPAEAGTGAVPAEAGTGAAPAEAGAAPAEAGAGAAPAEAGAAPAEAGAAPAEAGAAPAEAGASLGGASLGLDEDFFKVQVPDVLRNSRALKDADLVSVPNAAQTNSDDNTWRKVRGWYGELNFYSKIFQFFVQDMKDTESQYGWWIIVISSITSFITLFSLEPFGLSITNDSYYSWAKNLVISLLTVFTTLIASWVKKMGYVKRIQDIDKRIARLEKFLGILDFQFRLVPIESREDYLAFVTKHQEEHNELAVYSNLISPAEFSYTVYTITRFNTPIIRGTWPWYDATTMKPRKDFAYDIINTYESQYSWRAWLQTCLCCSWDHIDEYNPLLKEQIE